MARRSTDVQTYLLPLWQFFSDWKKIQEQLLNVNDEVTDLDVEEVSLIIGRWDQDINLATGVTVSRTPVKFKAEVLATRRGLFDYFQTKIQPIIDWLLETTAYVKYGDVLHNDLVRLLNQSTAVGGDLLATTRTIRPIIDEWKVKFVNWRSGEKLNVFEGIRAVSREFIAALDPDRSVSSTVLVGRKLEPKCLAETAQLYKFPGIGAAPLAEHAVSFVAKTDFEPGLTANRYGFGYSPDGTTVYVIGDGLAIGQHHLRIFEARDPGDANYILTVNISYRPMPAALADGFNAGAVNEDIDEANANTYLYAQEVGGKVLDYGWMGEYTAPGVTANVYKDYHSITISYDTRNSLNLSVVMTAATNVLFEVKVMEALPVFGAGYGTASGTATLIDLVGSKSPFSLEYILPENVVESRLTEITAYVDEIGSQLTFTPLAKLAADVRDALGSATDAFSDPLTYAFSLDFWFMNTRTADVLGGARVPMDVRKFKKAYRAWFELLKFLNMLTDIDLRFD
jgi:hypothetical protein